MNRWSNKVAIVTGASAGIGAQVCCDLVTAGMQVIGLARRVERVEALRERLPPGRRDAFHVRQCDVSQPAEVQAAFAWVAERFGCAHVLINNAGTGRCGSLLAKSGVEPDAVSVDGLRAVLETNLLGAVVCMREAVRLLDRPENAGEIGHLVNINSVSGHAVARNDAYVATMNMYPSSKHGLTAAIEVVRRELNLRGSRNLRITSISPGLTETEIFDAAGYGADMADELVNCLPRLKVADISAAIVYVLSAPQHVNVNEIILRATGAP